MIMGVGTDLVEIVRVQRILAQPWGMRFMERVLTPEEREHLTARLHGGKVSSASSHSKSHSQLNSISASVARPAAHASSGPEAERTVHPRMVEYTAGRFAAKEAIVKALGCGIGRDVGFQDVCILPAPSGQPICALSHAARSRLQLSSDVRIHLSITHTSGLAAAYAVIEQSGENVAETRPAVDS